MTQRTLLNNNQIKKSRVCMLLLNVKIAIFQSVQDFYLLKESVFLPRYLEGFLYISV